MSKPTEMETAILCILLAILLWLLCGGCNTAGNFRVHPNTVPDSKTIVETVIQTNWTPVFTVGGVFSGILLFGVASRKWGLWVLVAALGTTAYATMLDKFSWALAVMGLLLTLASLVLVWQKYRKTIFGFIDGFQQVKDIRTDKGDALRKSLNKQMGRHLSAEAEALVKKRKKQLEKKND